MEHNLRQLIVDQLTSAIKAGKLVYSPAGGEASLEKMRNSGVFLEVTALKVVATMMQRCILYISSCDDDRNQGWDIISPDESIDFDSYHTAMRRHNSPLLLSRWVPWRLGWTLGQLHDQQQLSSTKRSRSSNTTNL